MTDHSDLYHEVALPGKGMGVVASRLLLPGELLIAERPLLTVPWWQRLTEYNRTKYVGLSTAQLSPAHMTFDHVSLICHCSANLSPAYLCPSCP